MPFASSLMERSARAALSRASFLFALCLASPVVWAGLAAEGLQYPVWLVSDGERQALRPGDSVEPGEQVVTGENGKVWLRMEDGALVKLGQGGELSLKTVRIRPASTEAEPSQAAVPAQPARDQSARDQPAQKEASFMEAAFDVLEGAFRYTSQKLEQQWGRDVQIGLGNTATIGIRGTDLWGRVDGEDNFVVLLEGQIEVRAADASESLMMDVPLQIFQAAERALGSVEMAQVQALAPETELDAGKGVQTVDGAFTLNLASFSDQALAQAARERASQAGLATSVSEVSVEGRAWHRLLVTGLASLDDARALMTDVQSRFDYRSPWVSGG